MVCYVRTTAYLKEWRKSYLNEWRKSYLSQSGKSYLNESGNWFCSERSCSSQIEAGYRSVWVNFQVN